MAHQMIKREFLMTTVLLLKGAVDDEKIKVEFDKLLDTIAHTAPEVLDHRWMNIYNICSTHLTDMTDESHNECYTIYQNRLKDYSKEFN